MAQHGEQEAGLAQRRQREAGRKPQGAGAGMSDDGQERISCGISGLDEVLHGGLIPHRFYLVEGSPGAGKTTLAMQYLLEGVRAGERCLYVTLSETREELMAGMRSHGWTADGIEILELVVEEGNLDGDAQLTMYHPSEVELSETMRVIMDAVQTIQPQRMVLDSLSELRLLAQSALRYRRQILALKQFFAGRRCTVLLLDDRTTEGPDLQLQSVAHGVISLEHKAPAYGCAMRQLQVVKFRGSDHRTGRQDMRIGREGMLVFPRLTAADRGSEFRPQQIASGVTALDELMCGGIDRGTATLLIGPPGSGKSTVALQYAAAAALRGDRAVMFLFEECRAVLLSRAAGLGLEIEPREGAGRIDVRQIDATAVSPGEFAHMVQQAVERDDARVIVIDSLNGYLNAMPEDRFLTAQLHELLSYLNNHGVVSFLIATQTGIVGTSMRAPIDASYLADTVVLLRSYEHAGKVKKAISVVKKRSGDHEESIRRLWFDSEGVHMSEPLAHLRGVLTGIPVEMDGASYPFGGGKDLQDGARRNDTG